MLYYLGIDPAYQLRQHSFLSRSAGQPKLYCGVDIGGTSIKGVLLNGLEKQEVNLHSVPTPTDRAAMSRALIALTDGLREGKALAGIGIGVPGAIDKRAGSIRKAPNVPYLDGWRIGDVFENLGAPVAVENDSRCFVLAEYRWGAAQGFKNIIGLAIGTGIGGGIIIDGTLYRGSHDAAGEFGHSIIALDEKNPSASVTFERLGAKSAYEKFGDRSTIIGIGVANLINAFDPDIIVLGGGGIAGGGINISVVRETAREFIMSPEAKKTPIVTALLGDAAQAIGAALLLQEPTGE